MTSAEAIHRAVVDGFARGLERALRAERPDLSWEVQVKYSASIDDPESGGEG